MEQVIHSANSRWEGDFFAGLIIFWGRDDEPFVGVHRSSQAYQLPMGSFGVARIRRIYEYWVL